MSCEADPLEWHVISASAEEIDEVCAQPSAFYAESSGSRSELWLTAQTSVAVRDKHAMHWLLSDGLPGEEGPGGPLEFLAHGGTEVLLGGRAVFVDGQQWSVQAARWFTPEARADIQNALTGLDRESVARKGGAESVVAVQRLCELLKEDAATRFAVSANVCFLIPTQDLPIFSPPPAAREELGDRHGSGNVSASAILSGTPLGGSGFIGFGAGPALAIPVATMRSLDMTQSAPSFEECWRRALERGDGLIAYQRLADWTLYANAFFWLRLGYFETDEVIDQLTEEGDEEPEVIRHVVSAASAILGLEQRTWPQRTDCDRLFTALEQLRSDGFLVFEYAGFLPEHGFELVEDAMQRAQVTSRSYVFFHQQGILNAIDGVGLDLYFGEAVNVEGLISSGPNNRVGERVAEALTTNGLVPEWIDNENARPMVRMVWQCRPRPLARALPQAEH